MVGQIERLRPELRPEALAVPENFEDRKIDVVSSRTAQISHEPRHVSECEIPGLAEHRGIEILIDALVDAAVDLGILAIGVRPLPD